jgi:hypothetical protein
MDESYECAEKDQKFQICSQSYHELKQDGGRLLLTMCRDLLGDVGVFYEKTGIFWL